MKVIYTWYHCLHWDY